MRDQDLSFFYGEKDILIYTPARADNNPNVFE
jgi:hypothetical protein